MSNILVMAFLRQKWQNEVVAGNNGRGPVSSARNRRAQKEKDEYLKREQAHTLDYWTRDTMLEAIGKSLECHDYDAAQAGEWFGEFSDEELMRYFYLLPERYQPRGTSTSDNELLIAPDSDLILYRALEKRRS